MECTTDADGNGIITVKVGETYTLKGSISGYEKTVTIEENTDTIKDMPDGKIVYWYGIFSKESGGLSKAYSDNVSYQGLDFFTNYFRNYNKSTSTYYNQYAATVNKIDCTNYSRMNVIYKHYRTTPPNGMTNLSNTSYFIMTDRTKDVYKNSDIEICTIPAESTDPEITTRGKDISLTGSYYIEVFDNYFDAGALTYAIWLE